jgi:cysteinyl-tRNA synthetase
MEPFDLPYGQTVKMFVCGPTVYDYPHLGHARTYLAFDMIARYLTYLGYNVRYLMNITDVAERIVQRAKELGKEPLEVAKEYEGAFLDDMRALGIENVERYERASHYIPQMISQVRSLIHKGAAYETETGVYFEVNKFPKFGQLSRLSAEELGLRRLELCSSKHNVEDFSLWRKHDKTNFGWDSPWGHGRPGWHLEDTAISMTNLGETYDVHGGASELMFPHHEAEIAQAETLSGKTPFVRFWLHTGLLSLRGRKMSKSLGNVIRIRDALKDYTAQELRYYFASYHYRQAVVISDAGLKQARHGLEALRRNFTAFADSDASEGTHKNGKKLIVLTKRAEEEFRRCMDNDFNTPRALTMLESFARLLLRFSKPSLIVDRESKQEAEITFRKMGEVFGILS